MQRVLVVDDAPFLRMMVSKLLTENGYEIAGEAENGEDAIQKYKELKPDIVTMDITMPVKTGLEALREIIEYDKDAKVVMVTAMGQQSMVFEAIQLGAKSFIVKPFKDDIFIGTIKQVI